MIGEQIIANMQGVWKGEKVVRLTDRVKGEDEFVEINKPISGPAGEIMIKNNITQGKYDAVVTEAPQTDTVREQNMNLLIEWTKKSPPEAIPHILLAAFELSNMPNKEQLLARIRPLLGIAPGDENLSPEELKQKTIEALEAQKEQQQKQAEMQDKVDNAELEAKVLENLKTRAEIREIDDGIKIDRAKAVGDMKAKDKQAAVELSRQQTESKDKRRGQLLDFQAALKKADAAKAKGKAAEA
jgi:hypothetical protein